MAIYNFFLWIFTKKDKASLFFSFFCFIMALRILVLNRYLELNFNFDNIFQITSRLEFISMSLSVITFLLYLKSIIIKEFSKIIFYIIVTISLIYTLTVIFFPVWVSCNIYVFYFILLLIAGSWVIYMNIVALKNRRIGSVILLLGIIFLFFTVTLDVIFSFLAGVKTNTFQIGMLVLIFSQSFILSKRFATAYKTAEHLSKNLQIEVDNQTKIILEKNGKLLFLNEKITDLYKDKTDYFVNLSHELKTPLTLILNYLKKYIEKKGHDNDIDIINENVHKLKKDIINFLDHEKLEKGQEFYNDDQITNISVLLKDALSLFKETASQKKIKIESKIENKIIVKADPYAIDRIIYNLLDNAIKYNNVDGKIIVELKLNKDKIILIIKDSGIGISEETLENIFKPYYQISHKKSNINGIGMGLNIVKKIIDNLDGKIEVKSKLNEGTEFRVVLKKYSVKDNKDIVRKIERENLKPISFKKIPDDSIEKADRHTILIIEDNIDMLRYLKETLEEKYNIFTAKNGVEAFEKLENIKKLNLILSDIMMDAMDGYEFYENFKYDEINKGIPVIFLTAKNTEFEKIKALKKGAVDFINKPFDIEELKAKIDSLIQIEQVQYTNIKKELINKISDVFKKNKNISKDNYIDSIDKKCLDYYISTSEKKILLLLLQDKMYKEIADDLFISINTVKGHISNIYKKCNIKNKTELLKLFKYK